MQPITIIVPAYNEENGITQTVMQLDKLKHKLPKGSEIIIVNDGSKDKTKDRLKELYKKYDFKFFSHVVNTGYGAALKTGVRLAKNDLIMITDADGTYPNDRIPEFIESMTEEISMVVGARVGEGAHIPAIRKPAKWFIRKLASYLSGRNIPDLNSGMRLMRKDLILKYSSLLPNGFSFTTTITLALLVNGYQVMYIPIEYFKREGKSKIKPIRDTLNFINLIITTISAFQPNKFFIPLSFITFFAFLAALGRDLYHENLSDSSLLTFVLFLNTVSLTLLSNMISKKS